MQAIVNFAAPAAAGAVFAISTLQATLMIDIATAILGTGLLSCLALPRQPISARRAGAFSDIKIGVRYAFSDRLIGKLLIVYGLFTFFLPVGMAVFGPLADILPLQWIMIGSGAALILIAGIT